MREAAIGSFVQPRFHGRVCIERLVFVQSERYSSRLPCLEGHALKDRVFASAGCPLLLSALVLREHEDLRRVLDGLRRQRVRHVLSSVPAAVLDRLS